eukprot:NODE_85_length_22232_cov_1.318619.p7 type:complete len:275 gc:universal NODE_85_length_22232_cov_1.318619:16909-16085(-)
MRVNDAIHLVRKRGKKPNVENEGVKKTAHLKPSYSIELLPKTSDSNLKKIRKTVYAVLTNPSFNALAKFYSIAMSLIILGSVLEFVLESVYSLNNTEDQAYTFSGFELFFNIVFSIDYFTKIVFFPELQLLPRYLVKPFWLIDLISILPFYIDLASSGSSNAAVLRVVRIVRIFRIFRLLKASKNMKQVHLVGKALSRSREAIAMLIFLIMNGLFFFGSFVYYAEAGISDMDPQTNFLVYNSGPLSGSISAFQSIPHSMWWCIVTLTTVGYGDM